MMRSTGAALGAASLAGCSSLTGGSSTPEYQQWAPAPENFYEERDHYAVISIRVEDLVDNKSELNSSVNLDEDYGSGENSPFDLSAEDIDVQVFSFTFSATNYSIQKGSFDQSSLTSSLEDSNQSEEEDYSGYTIFKGSGSSDSADVAYAVDGSYIVEATGSDPVAKVKTLLDTNEGDADRYGDANDDFSELQSRLGDGTQVIASTHEETSESNPKEGEFEGEVAAGSAQTVNGEKTEVKSVITFESESDIDSDAFKTYMDNLEDSSSELAAASNLEREEKGRSVIIEGESETDATGFFL